MIPRREAAESTRAAFSKQLTPSEFYGRIVIIRISHAVQFRHPRPIMEPPRVSDMRFAFCSLKIGYELAFRLSG